MQAEMGISYPVHTTEIPIQARNKPLFTGTANNKSESTVHSVAHVLI